MSIVKDKYPEMKFVQYSGGVFPFEDKQFEWSYSNAVIEHVGDLSAKIEFINEMNRVSKNVFLQRPINTFHWMRIPWFGLFIGKIACFQNGVRKIILGGRKSD